MSTLPVWVGFAIVISMALMLGLSINYRSFTLMNGEIRENEQLTIRIQSIADENLQLQEEIHNLKSDVRVVRREAVFHQHNCLPLNNLPFAFYSARPTAKPI
jgi:cell division protein FtsB